MHWDASTRDGHHNFLGEGTVCVGLSRSYRHIRKVSIRTFGHRMTNPEIIEQSSWSTLKLKECELFTDRSDYLGDGLKPKWLAVSSDIIDRTSDLRTQSIIPALGSLLGLWNVSRRFVSNFARMAGPLNH